MSLLLLSFAYAVIGADYFEGRHIGPAIFWGATALLTLVFALFDNRA